MTSCGNCISAGSSASGVAGDDDDKYQRWNYKNPLQCCQKSDATTTANTSGNVFNNRRSVRYIIFNNKNNYMVTILLVLIPSCIFFAGIGPHYITEYHLLYPLIVQFILVSLSIIFLIITRFSNPGIISRMKMWPFTANGRQTNFNYRGPNYKQHILIGGRLVELKWCHTCRVFRPPRSFHCYICGHCVERFDHHCPWIGNCIGIGNYVYFSVFVNCLFFLGIWTLIFSVLLLEFAQRDIHNRSSKTNSEIFAICMKREPFAVFVSIYIFFAIWFVAGLTTFHWFLVCIGKTTNEQLRNITPIGVRFSRSTPGNCFDVCCILSPDKQRRKIMDVNRSQSQRNNATTTELDMNCRYLNTEEILMMNNAQIVNEMITKRRAKQQQQQQQQSRVSTNTTHVNVSQNPKASKKASIKMSRFQKNGKLYYTNTNVNKIKNAKKNNILLSDHIVNNTNTTKKKKNNRISIEITSLPPSSSSTAGMKTQATANTNTTHYFQSQEIEEEEEEEQISDQHLFIHNNNNNNKNAKNTNKYSNMKHLKVNSNTYGYDEDDDDDDEEEEEKYNTKKDLSKSGARKDTMDDAMATENLYAYDEDDDVEDHMLMNMPLNESANPSRNPSRNHSRNKSDLLYDYISDEDMDDRPNTNGIGSGAGVSSASLISQNSASDHRNNDTNIDVMDSNNNGNNNLNINSIQYIMDFNMNNTKLEMSPAYMLEKSKDSLHSESKDAMTHDYGN